jgi:hypothetical protein
MVGGSLEVSQSDMIKKAEVATGIATSSPIASAWIRVVWNCWAHTPDMGGSRINFNPILLFVRFTNKEKKDIKQSKIQQETFINTRNGMG